MKTKEPTTKGTAFDPSEHLTDIKGKPYLPVAWRLVWFREAHPDWSIQTEIKTDFEAKRCIAKATILDEAGRVIAMAHKVEDAAGFGDYVEKSETGSIGRALAMCGFGTQFSPDIEEGTTRIVDAPVEIKATPKPKYINTVEEVQAALPFCEGHGVFMEKVAKTGKPFHTDNIDGEFKTCFGHGYVEFKK